MQNQAIHVELANWQNTKENTGKYGNYTVGLGYQNKYK